MLIFSLDDFVIRKKVENLIEEFDWENLYKILDLYDIDKKAFCEIFDSLKEKSISLIIKSINEYRLSIRRNLNDEKYPYSHYEGTRTSPLIIIENGDNLRIQYNIKYGPGLDHNMGYFELCISILNFEKDVFIQFARRKTYQTVIEERKKIKEKEKKESEEKKYITETIINEILSQYENN